MNPSDQTTGALLVCEGVTKTFGSLRAVDGLSLTVRPGEVVGLGGPNGAGKTTFFDVVTAVTTDQRRPHPVCGPGHHRACGA